MSKYSQAEKDKIIEERFLEVLKQYNISTQDEFIEAYNELYSSEEYMPQLKDQSYVSRKLKQFNIKKNNDNIYVKRPKISNQDRLIRIYAKEYIDTIQYSDNVVMANIHVINGKEQFVCEAIQRKFNLKNSAIIPAYGSIVILGDEADVKRVKSYLTSILTKNAK